MSPLNLVKMDETKKKQIRFKIAALVQSKQVPVMHGKLILDILGVPHVLFFCWIVDKRRENLWPRRIQTSFKRYLFRIGFDTHHLRYLRR